MQKHLIKPSTDYLQTKHIVCLYIHLLVHSDSVMLKSRDIGVIF